MEPVSGGSVPAYADDITVFVTEMEHLQKVGEAFNVVGVRIYREKSVGLQLGTWRERESMTLDSIV